VQLERGDGTLDERSAVVPAGRQMVVAQRRHGRHFIEKTFTPTPGMPVAAPVRWAAPSRRPRRDTSACTACKIRRRKAAVTVAIARKLLMPVPGCFGPLNTAASVRPVGVRRGGGGADGAGGTTACTSMRPIVI
jgi:hypothetical protein